MSPDKTPRTLTCLRAGTHRQAGSLSDLSACGHAQAENPERVKRGTQGEVPETPRSLNQLQQFGFINDQFKFAS